MKIKAVGAYSAKQPLEPMDITRREPGPHDVKIEIAYCGVCHSDIHRGPFRVGGDGLSLRAGP